MSEKKPISFEDSIRDEVNKLNIEELRERYKSDVSQYLRNLDEFNANDLREICMKSESIWYSVCIGMEMKSDLSSAKALGLID